MAVSNNMARWCWFLYKNGEAYHDQGEDDKAREIFLRLVNNAWAPRYVHIGYYQWLAIIAPDDIVARSFLDKALRINNRLLESTDVDRGLNERIKAHTLKLIDQNNIKATERIAKLTAMERDSSGNHSEEGNPSGTGEEESNTLPSGSREPEPSEEEMLESLGKMKLGNAP